MTGNISLLVLPIVLLAAPLVLSIAAKQKVRVKQKLRRIFQISLTLILFLSFLNWESLSQSGRNSFQLALTARNPFLWLFLAVNTIQIITLQTKSRKADVMAVILNALNTFIFFISAITISNTLGKQIVSPAIITTAMTVLVNNVLGLALINKDPKILQKYQFPKGSSRKTKQK